MLAARVYRIYQRYADLHVSLERPGRLLRDAAGTEFGQVERLRLYRNRLIVEGWAEADRVGLHLNRTRVWALPDLARAGSARRGFTLDIPFDFGTPELLAEQGGETVSTTLPGFSETAIRWRRRRLSARFLRTLAELAPVIWRWKRQGDLGAREVVKERLGLVPRSDAAEMTRALVLPPEGGMPAVRRPYRSATIVLPVYNAFDLLTEALERVARHSDLDWRLVLIEDCSTDARVRPFLEEWSAARADRVTLMKNDRNLGFIGAVNRGFAVARERWPEDPVVLLNSDALVPANWLSRLIAPLAEPDAASVTPLSNDAEIFTLPVICQRNMPERGTADSLDGVASRFHPEAGLVEAPTGVGFCMALAPGFLRRIPEFDIAFGRGYGEENDWCQKARALGGRHLCAPNLVVEHRGGHSFGSVDKQKLLERNIAEIGRRYPGYDAEVQDFIRRDPLTTSRLALGLVWAACQRGAEVPVYLAHSLGGGADKYLETRIAEEIEAGGSAVVLRVGQGHRWKLEVHTGYGVTRGLTNDHELIEALVALLPRRRIVYSCGVADRDAVTLPDLLLRLAGRGEGADPAEAQPVEMLVHDYFPISPDYTLLDHDGVHRGVPRPGTAQAEDPAHLYERPGGTVASLAEWQGEWGRLAAAAERITVFSEASRALMIEAYPAATPALEVRPHRLPAPPPRIAPGWDGRGAPVIGVLGNIGQPKGAALLQGLSRELARSGKAGLVVIGHLDPDYGLAPPAQVHGSYELRDLPGLVARYRIAAWLIPSIWPETFSFTTHEALATGLPVFCFDLGAQGDAVARAVAAGAPGAVLPVPEAKATDAMLARILGELEMSREVA